MQPAVVVKAVPGPQAAQPMVVQPYSEAPPQHPGWWIERAIKRAGKSVEDVADHMGVSVQAVYKWQRTGQIGKDRLAKLSKFLGTNAHYLLTGEDWDYFDAEPPGPDGRIHVPVVGDVKGGDDGFLEELGYPVGFGEGTVVAPVKDLRAYAVRVRGDSMRPRIKSGEFIVVEPQISPVSGDDVVVCLVDGRKLVKEYLYQRDGELSLGSINGDYQPMTVPLEQVQTIHVVTAILPRGSFKPK